MTDELLRMGAAELAEGIRKREISPVDLTQQSVARIHALQPSLNAFITINADAALRAARNAEREIANGGWRGPLHGIPYAAKDLIATASVRTTMGSRLLENHLPERDAATIARLEASGAILLGKTTTSEFGHKPLTDGPLFGRTINPFDSDATCGGSSGGSAVAVATHQVPVALGSDGGGSVRIPAACCGIVGLKATLGVIPHLDVPDLFAANSYVGPMGRTIADTRMLFQAVRGFDLRDPYGQGFTPHSSGAVPEINGIRIGWLERVGNPVLHPECRDAALEALDALTDLGATVEPVELDFVALEDAFLIIMESLLRSRLLAHRQERGELLDPSLVQTIDQGEGWTAVDLQRAGRARTENFLAIQSVFERFDVLASPTLAAPPISVHQDPHGRIAIGDRDAGRIRGGWYPYTYAFNLTGHPALSIPCGWTGSGLPLGLQIAGPWHSEDLLLHLGAWMEREAVPFVATQDFRAMPSGNA